MTMEVTADSLWTLAYRLELAMPVHLLCISQHYIETAPAYPDKSADSFLPVVLSNHRILKVWPYFSQIRNRLCPSMITISSLTIIGV